MTTTEVFEGHRGSGKTTWLVSAALRDAMEGRSSCVVAPNPHMARHALALALDVAEVSGIHCGSRHRDLSIRVFEGGATVRFCSVGEIPRGVHRLFLDEVAPFGLFEVVARTVCLGVADAG